MAELTKTLPDKVFFAYDKAARKIASPGIQKEYGYDPEICKLFDEDSWTTDRRNLRGFYVTQNQLSQVTSLTHTALEADA